MNVNDLAVGFAPEFMNASQPQQELPRDCEEVSCPLPDGRRTRSVPLAGKPMVVLPADEKSTFTECANDLWKAIGDQQAMYWRGNSGQGQHPVVARLIEDCRGNIQLGTVDCDTLRAEMPNVVSVFGWRRDRTGAPVLKPNVLCSADVAGVLLKADAIRRHLPAISAVHANPIITASGTNPQETAVLARGYHAQSGGRLITGGTVPQEMTLREAVEALDSILQDFVFPTPGDRSRALAAMIMPALKFGGLLLSHTPMFIFEAEQSQTGKGYLAELIQAVYGEVAKLIAQTSRGGVGSFDEKLSQALIDGNPFIQIDNVRGKINSPLFEVVLTCPGTVGARVPHQGEIKVNPNPFVFHVTSNGYEATEDLANRSCIIRIRKNESQVFYPWEEGDLIRHVQAHQGQYLGAVFTIVKAWVGASKQKSACLTWGGRFREWWQTADWIVREILGQCPVLDGHQQARERATNPMLAWLREIAIALEGNNRLGVEFRTSALCDFSHDHEIEIPGITGNVNDDKIHRRVGVKLSSVFREANVREIDSFVVEKVQRAEWSEDRRENVPRIKYVFRRVPASEEVSPSIPASQQPVNTP